MHGQDDLFAALIGEVRHALLRAEQATLVQLGDIVDRGPASLLSLRRARLGIPGVESVTLMGNHEDAMMRALLSEDRQDAALWLEYGGDATLAEAGLTARDPDWRGGLLNALGKPMVTWLVSLPKMFRLGDLLFVHGGIDPRLPLARQDPRALMWMRSPFIESRGPYDQNVAVIHGHTPQASLSIRHPHRINLDTGAFASGVLSALLIHGDRMRTIQVSR